MSLVPHILYEHLPSFMTEALGTVTVKDLQPLKGGYSREMWSFDSLTESGVSQPWILCADSSGGVVGSDSLDRQTEARLLDIVHQAGVPVPSILGVNDQDNPLGVAWFIMQRVEGTAAVGPILRDPWYAEHRARFADQKAGILAAIHAIEPPFSIFGVSASDIRPAEIAPNEIQRWAQALDETPESRTATLDESIEWLSKHLPCTPDRVTIVHGDFRTGNLLYDHTGIRSVLDWEMAHLGDPVEDLGWAQLVCWRLGTGRVGGIAEFEQWPALYERMGGAGVDRDSLHFWETLSSLKMSILAWRAAERTPAGREHELLFRLYNDLENELRLRLLV